MGKTLNSPEALEPNSPTAMSPRMNSSENMFSEGRIQYNTIQYNYFIVSSHFI